MYYICVGILESSRREGAHSPSVRKGYQHSIPLAANQLDTQAASGNPISHRFILCCFTLLSYYCHTTGNCLPLWDIGPVPLTLLCACWGGEKPSADPEVTVNGFPQVSGMPMGGKATWWFYSILMVDETMNIWTSGDTWACSQKKHIKRRSGKRRQVQFVGAEACQCDGLKAPPLRHCSEAKQSPSLPGVPQRTTLQSRSISPNASASQRTENSWIISRAGCMGVF